MIDNKIVQANGYTKGKRLLFGALISKKEGGIKKLWIGDLKDSDIKETKEKRMVYKNNILTI